MTPVLELRGIVKRFGPVLALDAADFTVYPQEVVALIGDNGAGKSTLVKTISGVQEPDAGEILIDGKPCRLSDPMTARGLGIETVYQDLAVAPELDSVANLYLGRELLRPGLLGALGFLDKKTMRARSEEAFKALGVGLRDLSSPVASLSGGQRQGVAVARATQWAKKVVLMDEPTAALGVVQTRAVLDLVKRVKEAGLSVVYVSHNMPEVLEVADRVEVLRLGQRVAQFRAVDASIEDLVGAMTGAVGVGEGSR